LRGIDFATRDFFHEKFRTIDLGKFFELAGARRELDLERVRF
jgi:hypothetical protein